MLTKLEKLKGCKDRKELASQLGIKPSDLSYTIYKISAKSRYQSFNIRKASGGIRTIHAPNSRLKSIQRRVSNLLYDCYKEIHPTTTYTNRELSHAFQKKRGLSIASNATKHKNRRFVFNLDFKDFFGCFNFGRVRGYFLSNNDFQLNPEVATTLAQICCHNNKLPQGAPTSPIVTELITRILDIRLSKIASKNGCRYSRYADDLTFSTNKRTFPDAIAKEESDGILAVGHELLNKIHNSGFLVNQKKTRMHFCDSRQEATGLIINKKVNVSKEYTKQVRSMCYSLFKKGECHIVPPNSSNKIPVSASVLGGKLAHMFYIKTREYLDSEGKPFRLDKFKISDKRYEIPAFYERYRQYIYFQNFYYNQMPTILCEGKTDPVYLRCAIKSLASSIPLLSSGDTSKNNIDCQFFNYSKTAMSVTCLTGGAKPIKNFVITYDKDSSIFTAPNGQANPVIVVVDNDDANKGLKSILKTELEVDYVDFSKPFYHVTKNLYIVPIPIPIKKEYPTDIEDLFDEETLNIELNKKKFKRHQGNGVKLGKKEYSKWHFAKHVVLKKQETIDFSGFLPLLKNIESVIKDHKDKKTCTE